MAELLPLAIVAVFLAIGLGMVLVGGLRLRRWRTMRKLDPTGSMAAEEGLQEFEGRAHAVDGALTAPFTGSESLVCEHKAEKYRHNDDGSNWRTLDSETRSVPFEIDHGGSTVAVDPGGAQFLLTDEFQVDTRKTDSVPDRVQAFVEQKLDRSMDGPSLELGPIELGGNRRYRFTEERLDDGEEVYVLGPVRREPRSAPPGSDARLVIDLPDRGWKEKLFGDPFVVADTGEDRAVRRQLKAGLALVGIGVLFSAIPAVTGYLILFG